MTEPSSQVSTKSDSKATNPLPESQKEEMSAKTGEAASGKGSGGSSEGRDTTSKARGSKSLPSAAAISEHSSADATVPQNATPNSSVSSTQASTAASAEAAKAANDVPVGPEIPPEEQLAKDVPPEQIIDDVSDKEPTEVDRQAHEFTAQLSDLSDQEGSGGFSTLSFSSNSRFATWFHRMRPLMRSKKVRILGVVNFILLTIAILLLLVIIFVLANVLVLYAEQSKKLTTKNPAKDCFYSYTKYRPCSAPCYIEPRERRDRKSNSTVGISNSTDRMSNSTDRMSNSTDRMSNSTARKSLRNVEYPRRYRSVDPATVVRPRKPTRECPEELLFKIDSAPCNIWQCPRKLSSFEFSECFFKDASCHEGTNCKCYRVRLVLNNTLVLFDVNDLAKPCDTCPKYIL